MTAYHYSSDLEMPHAPSTNFVGSKGLADQKLIYCLEVDRAIDNLVKSGKMFNMPGRRDSVPIGGPPPRDFSQQFGKHHWEPPPHKADSSLDPRMGGGPPRHHSVSDFGDSRSYSGSNLQNFYASQRHQPSRGANEAEQVMQAKRRMAAQRERELRNYHQEQQYNRSRPPSSVSSVTPV
jgi:hypothetical protein